MTDLDRPSRITTFRFAAAQGSFLAVRNAADLACSTVDKTFGRFVVDWADSVQITATPTLYMWMNR